MAKIKFFKEPLSDKEYVKRSDNCCPFCGSDNVEGAGVDVHEGGCTQEVVCQRCYACWYDEYKLTGYTTVSHPEKEDDEDEEES